MRRILFKLGRFLQFVGLVLLPVGMAGNAAERLTLGQMLVVCAVGTLVFFAGWLLQQASRPQ